MMSSLVAYDSSGEESSDVESEGEVCPKPTTASRGGGGGLGLPSPKVVHSEPLPKEERQKAGCSMFASLPPPKREPSAVGLAEEESPVVKTKPAKQKVKITIPSLADFKDDEEFVPKAKKPKLTPKGSGLLAMLPAPKNMMSKSNRVMVPHVLTRKPVPKPVTKKPLSASSKTLVSGYVDSDDSGDESVDHKGVSSSAGIDFFSLTSQVTPEAAIINLEDLLPPTAGPSKRPASHMPAVSRVVETQDWPEPEHQPQPQQDLQLDEEALRQLCGRRGTKAEELNIIELHGDNMLPDPKDWMLKQMTEEQEQHRSSQPSSAHKRKHQITYLAFQAKEREIELKNQWAQNRMTKKQTQAKYGF